MSNERPLSAMTFGMQQTRMRPVLLFLAMILFASSLFA
jgi:hypothetical protein